MGANQSSNDGAGASKNPAGSEVKTSYYELLSIDRQATDDEVKKAYRRKALELHPDRNYGDVERTTKLFADVQTAYQILSDPQERAWYDSHESAILRGDDADMGADGEPARYERNVGVTSADDITRLLRRFNANVDYTDAPSGFFGFVRETFETLAREEEFAAARDGGGGGAQALPEFPSFGHKEDEYDDVVKGFYAGWNGFATRKSFAWRDRYRTADAEDRRTRRLMDKENRRFRDEGIREFNDAVRLLVAFVRKRDPRYTPNTQTEGERQDALRKAAAAQAAAARAANAAKVEAVVPEWTKTREPEELEEEEDEESDEEHFECVACRKTFKSENQYDAHERSKKHLKAVQALRRKLQREGHELDLDDDDDDDEASTGAGEGVVVDDSRAMDDTGEATTAQDGNDLPQAGEEANAGQDGDGLRPAMDELNIAEEPTPLKKTVVLDRHHSSSSSNDNDTDASDEDDHPPHPADLPKAETPPPASPLEADDTPKLGKAAQKRAKKAAQQANSTSQGDHSHTCATCNAAFPSKTRLFQHIKDHGHAAPVPGAAAGKKGGKGQGGKRK